jgi:hypothetical protein
MSTYRVRVIAAMDADHESEASLDVQELTTSERTKGALKKLGLFWAMAVGSIFLPVMHFVLVPTFFIVGIVQCSLTFQLTKILHESELTCPKCKSKFMLPASAFNWPKREACPKCQSPLLIQMKT